MAARFGLGIAPVQAALQRLLSQDRLLEGEFLPGGRGREWCDVTVLRRLKGRSLAKLRKQIEPVEPASYANFLTHWQHLARPKRGLDGLLDVLEQLQGLPLPASEWETSYLPARIVDFQTGMLDELSAAGEDHLARATVRCKSVMDESDCFSSDALPSAVAALPPIEDELEQQIFELLAQQGALFFDKIVQAFGGFRQDFLDGLWRLVWAGRITNDTLAPLRSLRQANSKRQKTGGSHRRRSKPFAPAAS